MFFCGCLKLKKKCFWFDLAKTKIKFFILVGFNKWFKFCLPFNKEHFSNAKVFEHFFHVNKLDFISPGKTSFDWTKNEENLLKDIFSLLMVNSTTVGQRFYNNQIFL